MEEAGEGGKKREEEAQKQREEARMEETTHSAGEGVAEKHVRRDKSDREIDTEAGEAGTSQLISRHKKRHMTNIHLMDSDKEAIVDFEKDQEELYYMTNEHFKDKTRKECFGERFVNSRKLSKWGRLGLNSKGLISTSSCSPSLIRLQKK